MARNSELEAQIRQLQAELAAEKSRKTGGSSPSLKLAQKGGVSINGLGQFPLTLYRSGIARLEAAGILFPGPVLQQWLTENVTFLSDKADSPADAQAKAERRLARLQREGRKGPGGSPLTLADCRGK